MLITVVITIFDCDERSARMHRELYVKYVSCTDTNPRSSFIILEFDGARHWI